MSTNLLELTRFWRLWLAVSYDNGCYKGNNVYLLTFSVFFVILYTILSKCRLNATSSVGVNIDALLEEALSLTLDNILCDTSSSNQKLRDTVKLCRV